MKEKLLKVVKNESIISTMSTMPNTFIDDQLAFKNHLVDEL